MQVLDQYVWKRKRKQKVPFSGAMVCEVIVCTIASGKVRRRQFASWDEAHAYSEEWQEKNSGKPTYLVEIQLLNKGA